MATLGVAILYGISSLKSSVENHDNWQGCHRSPLIL